MNVDLYTSYVDIWMHTVPINESICSHEPCYVLFDHQQVVCRSKELEMRDERVVVLDYDVECSRESIVDIARREEEKWGH